MISKEEVEHLAKLARIELWPSEAEDLTAEIGSILGYVGQIKEASGEINAEMEKKIPKLRNVMRDDIPTNTPGQYTEEILKNAPSRQGNYLKVKKIL